MCERDFHLHATSHFADDDVKHAMRTWLRQNRKEFYAAGIGTLTGITSKNNHWLHTHICDTMSLMIICSWLSLIINIGKQTDNFIQVLCPCIFFRKFLRNMCPPGCFATNFVSKTYKCEPDGNYVGPETSQRYLGGRIISRKTPLQAFIRAGSINQGR